MDLVHQRPGGGRCLALDHPAQSIGRAGGQRCHRDRIRLVGIGAGGQHLQFLQDGVVQPRPRARPLAHDRVIDLIEARRTERGARELRSRWPAPLSGWLAVC